MSNFRDAAAAIVNTLTSPVRFSAFNVVENYKYNGRIIRDSKAEHLRVGARALLANVVTLGIVSTLYYRNDPEARNFWALRKSAKIPAKPTLVG